MTNRLQRKPPRPRPVSRWALRTATLACAAGAMWCVTSPAALSADPPGPHATIENTREVLGRWIETQQIISRERKDWQQGKDIMVNRIDLVKQEIASLEERIAQAQASVDQANQKRDALLTENEQLKAANTQLTQAVTGMEGQVQRVFALLPEPVQSKVQPLYGRIPDASSSARVSAAERFQNVLGVLNEVNKANTEISVNYEVRTLSSGKPSEVRTIYVGLAQAYYLSAGGEAGIGRPTPEGWTWEPSKLVAGDVLLALEILQGKHTPAFVPLPVKLQ